MLLSNFTSINEKNNSKLLHLSLNQEQNKQMKVRYEAMSLQGQVVNEGLRMLALRLIFNTTYLIIISCFFFIKQTGKTIPKHRFVDKYIDSWSVMFLYIYSWITKNLVSQLQQFQRVFWECCCCLRQAFFCKSMTWCCIYVYSKHFPIRKEIFEIIIEIENLV